MAREETGLRRYSFQMQVQERLLDNELAHEFASYADAVREAYRIAWELVSADRWWLTAKAMIIVTDDRDNELAIPVGEGAEHHRLAAAVTAATLHGRAQLC
ncbi:hypothetical protein [Rhodoplanes roseus]|uniref:Uncharacterized protein n=1 Tax=Rhodoplanes roseus TaxID=29409 RepID=A0A327KVA6_9BRAD|nr:hypothetical protein [Rhodoplanes roseus]RAI42830.1 hypothetical protein CH341_17420 [Rhodoplanes roseus]